MTLQPTQVPCHLSHSRFQRAELLSSLLFYPWYSFSFSLSFEQKVVHSNLSFPSNLHPAKTKTYLAVSAIRTNVEVAVPFQPDGPKPGQAREDAADVASHALPVTVPKNVNVSNAISALVQP